MFEIVQEFANELPDRAKAIEVYLEQGDLAQIQVLAHQLKGAGGGYGFSPITDVAGGLEQALKEGADISVIKEQVQAMCETLRAVTVAEAD